MYLLNVTNIGDKAAVDWTRWISFPTSWEISSRSIKKNLHLKRTLSHFTRQGQILILSSLARWSTANSEGLGRISLSNSLYGLNSRHCDHDNWWKTMQSTEKPAHLHMLTSSLTVLSSPQKQIRSCLGPLNFKVYVSAYNTKSFPTCCNQHFQLVEINTWIIKSEQIEPHNTLKKLFTTKPKSSWEQGWFGALKNKWNIRGARVCANFALHSSGCTDVAMLPWEKTICQRNWNTNKAVWQRRTLFPNFRREKSS